MAIQRTDCDGCGGNVADFTGFMRCQRGHFVCESCVKAARRGTWGRKPNTCPKCRWVLISQEAYINQPSIEQMIMRDAGKMQITWSKYLFRNPDLVLVMLSWGFSLIFLVSAGRNRSFFSNVLEWMVGSIFVAIAPLLTLMYSRKKKTGLGMFAGWMAAWRGDRRPVFVIVGIASVLFLIRLMMETKPIG